MVKTFCVAQEGVAKSLYIDCNGDYSQVVIGSSAVFKIYSIGEESFTEVLNLRGNKSVNLNYSFNDVVWSKLDESLIATAATNGRVVLWNLSRTSREKRQEHVFEEHRRTVNKVNFHPADPSLLISGSQDGTMKLFDLRILEPVAVFLSNTQSVRDVQFCPHGNGATFAAVSENGHIQLWDIRRHDRLEKSWPAHSDHIFALDWHPEINYTVATAGRDKHIKVWDTTKAKLDHMLYTIGPVGTVKWRPGHKNHLASCSGLVGDSSVNVWDVRRPYIPYAVFSEHRNVATSIVWRGDPDIILSAGKDNKLFHHAFEDASRPSERANPAGLDISVRGDISHAYRDTRDNHQRSVQNVRVPPSPANISPVNTSTRSSTTVELGGVNFRVPSFLSKRDCVDNVERVDLTNGCGSGSTWKTVKHRGFRLRRTNVSQNELFLACLSKLETFMLSPPKYGGDNKAWTDTTHFVEAAKRLKLTGGAFDYLCEHNAKVCESCGRLQLAETWRMLRILFKNPLDILMEEMSVSCYEEEKDDKELLDQTSPEQSPQKVNNHNEDVPSLMPAIELDPEKDRLRHLSTRVRHHSASIRDRSGTGEFHKKDDPGRIDENEDLLRTKKRSSTGGTGNRGGGKNFSGSGSRNQSNYNSGDDDDDEEDFGETNELTLTNIASGQMLTGIGNDFFGDCELSADLGIDHLVAIENGAGSLGANYGYEQPYGWELKSEAFDLRVEIKESATQEDEEDFNQAGDHSSSDEPAVQTVTIEDQTSALLCVAEAHQRTLWKPNKIIRDLLFHFAEHGDVQTSVSMFLVLGQDKLQGLVEDHVVEYWFTSYIELLQQFQLFNVSTLIIKLCPLGTVNELSQQSTTFLTHCAKCSKALSRPQGSWWCERCKRTPTLCCLCQQMIKGLFAWCQGCAHGGHLNCLRRWYDKQTLCPTGCGHHCQYT